VWVLNNALNQHERRVQCFPNLLLRCRKCLIYDKFCDFRFVRWPCWVEVVTIIGMKVNLFHVQRPKYCTQSSLFLNYLIHYSTVGYHEKLAAPLPNSETRYFAIVECDLCETKVYTVYRADTSFETVPAYKYLDVLLQRFT
jgi:hypothetical protein